MKRLSKEAESQVLDALGSVADLVNELDEPNDAIIKAAKEFNIPAGHVNLMVTAYNTGRTNKQRMAADDPQEKAASFKLADPAVIMEALYPSKVKTRAEEKTSSVISSDYSRPPEFAQRKANAIKAARHIDWKLVDKKPEAYAADPKEAAARAYNSTVFNKKRLEECRREVTYAREMLSDGFQKLGTYFRTPGSISFTDAKTAAGIQHGRIGSAIMNQVARSAPFLEKQGASGYLVSVSADKAPFDTITHCVKLAKALLEQEKKYTELTAEVEKRAKEKLSPFVAAPGSRSVLQAPSSGNDSEKMAKGGGMAGIAGLALLSKNLGGARSGADAADAKAYESQVGKYVDHLANPAHEANLRQVKIRAMLEDLMTNDPVIRGYSPDDVIQAYNDIVDTAPRAADQRMLLQGLMRRHLSGESTTDPFDVQQNILGAEKLLGETQDVPAQIKLAPTPGRTVAPPPAG